MNCHLNSFAIDAVPSLLIKFVIGMGAGGAQSEQCFHQGLYVVLRMGGRGQGEQKQMQVFGPHFDNTRQQLLD
jgi:hypothetical protein